MLLRGPRRHCRVERVHTLYSQTQLAQLMASHEDLWQQAIAQTFKAYDLHNEGLAREKLAKHVVKAAGSL